MSQLGAKISYLVSSKVDGTSPRCMAPWQSLMIEVNGNVQPCAYRGNYTNTSARPSLGNINNNTLEEIWNGDEVRHLRRCMALGDLDAAGCGKCLAVSQGQALGLEYDDHALAEIAPSPYAKNLSLKLDEVLSGAEFCSSKPTVLYFTPDHRCNLACSHCYQNISRKASIERKAAGDELLELIPYLSDVVAGGGEPLILPFWRRFLSSEARLINPYMRFSTTTNATVLRDDVFEGISSFRRIAIIISLDGASRDVFEKIRMPARWEVFIENARRLRELCASQAQFFSFNISTMKANLHELADFVDFCSDFESPYNYQPVVSYPAEQSLRCFNNPLVQMQNWRYAIDSARETLFSRFFPAMENAARAGRVFWSDSYRAVYEGHISALEALIPWDLLNVEHIECVGQLPDFFIERLKWCYEVKTSRIGGQYAVLLFFRDEDASGAEPHYYAVLDRDLNFSISLPVGRYRVKAIPGDFALGTRSEAWADVFFDVALNGLTIAVAGAVVSGPTEANLNAKVQGFKNFIRRFRKLTPSLFKLHGVVRRFFSGSGCER